MIGHFLKLALAGALLAAGALAAAPARAEKVVVVVASQSVTFSPLFAAKALGYFDKLGLDVEIQSVGSGAKGAAAVMSGDAQVYVGATVPILLNTYNQGIDLVAFAAINTQLTSDIVVSSKWAAANRVTPDSSYEDKIAALKNIRIAISGPGGGPDQAVRYLARDARIDPDRQMQLVTMLPEIATMLAALEQGQVDAFSLGPPAAALAAKRFDAVTLFDFTSGRVKSLDGLMYIAAVGSSRWLKSSPDTAARFTAGLQMAIDNLRDPATREKAKVAMEGSLVPRLEGDVAASVYGQLDAVMPPTVEVTRPMLVKLVEFWNAGGGQKIDVAKADALFMNEAAAKGVAIARAAGSK